MKQILLLGLLLTFCLHIVNGAHAVNARIENVEKISANGTNCKTVGFKCLDCQNLQFCSWNEINNTYDEHIWGCYNGLTCSEGICIDQPETACSNNTTEPELEFEFECRTPGMYPDPFDCQKYYYCVPVGKGNNSTSNSSVIKYSAECDCDFAYNAYTKLCDIKLKNASDCFWHQSVADCFEKGQTGRVGGNFNIYYICLKNHITGKLYPYLYGCDHGKIYNSHTYLCE